MGTGRKITIFPYQANCYRWSAPKITTLLFLYSHLHLPDIYWDSTEFNADFSKNTRVTQVCFELLFLRQPQFSGEEIAQTQPKGGRTVARETQRKGPQWGRGLTLPRGSGWRGLLSSQWRGLSECGGHRSKGWWEGRMRHVQVDGEYLNLCEIVIRCVKEALVHS